jgi:3-dehydrosphinganine reductase
MLEAENKYKPMETKIISGKTAVMSPLAVAQAGLHGVARGKYMIIPGFENKMLYILSSFLMGAVHPVMDWMVARTQRQMKKQTHSER